MRGNIALVSLLTAGLLVGAHPVAGESATARATDLPQEVDGGVVVDLADGDRFKATVSRDLRTVWGSRYDAGTGVWGARRVVFKQKNVYCGDVDARAAGNAVALIAQCDEGGKCPVDVLAWGRCQDHGGDEDGGDASEEQDETCRVDRHVKRFRTRRT